MNQIITAESIQTAPLETSRDEVVAQANGLIIETPQDVETADSLLIRLAQGIDTIKAALEPMRTSTIAAWKAGTELEKRLVGPLEEAKKALSQNRGKAVARIQAEAAEAQARLLDEGNFDEAIETPAISKSGVTSRSVWRAEVVDLAKLARAAVLTHPSLLAYLKVDESALNKAAALFKEKLDIPGVKVVEDFSSTVRTGPAKSYREGFKQG